MAVLLGPVLGMFIPVLFTNLNIKILLYIYGALALLFMALYLIFVRDKPDSPPNPYSEKPMELGIKGTRDLIRPDFILLFVLMMIGIGVFNALTTGVDVLFSKITGLPAGLLLADAIGIIGGVMIVGGIIGAIILSTLSDKFRKRKIFLILAMISSTILTLLFYFLANFYAILIIAFFFGFMLISALPVGLTFAAEMTYPVPEETSNGWLMWSGQLSGIILIVIFMFLTIPRNILDTNFIIYVVLFAIGTVLTFFLKDLDAYELKT
jgi:predicted MFS family arabinose efflux permease